MATTQLTINIAADPAYTIGTANASIYIEDNLPTINITGAGSAREAGGNTGFTLQRSGQTNFPLTINIAMSGSAVNGTDYQLISSTATFAANAATINIPVTIIDDMTTESLETIVLTILTGSGYTVGTTNAALINLIDNDTTDTFAANTTLLLRAGFDGLFDVYNNTINSLGNNSIVTAGAKFNYSAAMTGGGWEIPQCPAITLGTGDWTIEFWYKHGNSPVAQSSIFAIDGADIPIAIRASDSAQSNQMVMIAGTSSTVAFDNLTCGTASISQFDHYAFTKAGNTYRAFKNGVQESTVTATGIDHTGTTAARVGLSTLYAGITGSIEELRITKACRYAANFTAPTEPFAVAPGVSYQTIIAGDGASNFWNLGAASGATGTIEAAIGSVTGTRVGTAQTNSNVFNGTDNLIDFVMTHPLTNYSYELWFKTGSNAGNNRPISFVNNSPTYNDRNLFLFAGNIAHRLWPAEQTIYSTSQSYDNNAWHHAVVTVQSGVGQKIYVDGVLVANGSASSSNATGAIKLTVGYGTVPPSFNGTSYFVGQIDRVAIYNSVLTLLQIQSHFNFGSP
jgi:hypothetical protein